MLSRLVGAELDALAGYVLAGGTLAINIVRPEDLRHPTLVSLVGGAIGCLLAFPMNGYSTGTGQTQSFSEIAFAFRITPGIVATGIVFAVVMGLVGGLLPALRAARLPITSALREA